MGNIHPTAVIDASAKIDSTAKIGPYCVIGSEVTIKKDVILKSHVCIEGETIIDEGTIIYPFASIGQAPQDLKYEDENSKTYIGKKCTIREYVTIQRGTKSDAMQTVVGNHCLLMVGCHVAHDCIVEDHVVMANYVSLAGHVHVGQHVVIGGHSAIQQYCRIGSHAMIGGMSGVDKDVIPYGLVKGERAVLSGLNLVGLRRFGFENKDIISLQNVYKQIFSDNKTPLKEKISLIQQKNQMIDHFKKFITEQDNRPFCLPK